MPGLASETVGVWADSGSRDESELTAGSTHFLEHMLFKGTRARTAAQIARTFDRIGGDSNAVTAKEFTCYYARCLVADLGSAVDVLWDMVLDPLLDPGEFERERGVILEELAMAADDPQDVLYEAFDELIYPGHPLGRPIGATKGRIRALDHATLLAHYRGAYTADRLVFVAAGGAEHAEVVERVTTAIAQLRPALLAPPGPAEDQTRPRSARSRPAFSAGVRSIRRDTEQQGLLYGVDGVSAVSEDRFAFSVLQSLLGGGMSSRLFQSVREEHGLAYSVHCSSSQHADCGDFALYAGCAPESAQRVLELCDAEFRRLAEEAPDAEEVEEVAAQLAASTVLGLESTATRMNRLASAELYGIALRSPEEIVARVRAVSAQDVRALAEALYAGPKALATVGPRELTLPA
ncbi:insulinase family protein [Brevibacterium sp. 5221]|uniref:Insulinase family protein n=1 Tax=Brevibacterium rongguiense TaxID=2695267 RepID=A0A6N9H7I8_9MICO|nr:insulinase family protein [Brevibacterium rongguiense]